MTQPLFNFDKYTVTTFYTCFVIVVFLTARAASKSVTNYPRRDDGADLAKFVIFFMLETFRELVYSPLLDVAVSSGLLACKIFALSMIGLETMAMTAFGFLWVSRFVDAPQHVRLPMMRTAVGVVGGTMTARSLWNHA